MQESPQPTNSLPGLAGARTAWAQLLGGDDSSPVGASALYYPAIGLLLGVAMVVVDGLVNNMSIETSSLAVMAFHVVATRGRPLNGLSRTTALSLGGRRAGDSAIFVSVFRILFFLLSVWILSGVDGGRVIALLFAPMLSRCSMVVIATGSREARSDGKQMKFSRELTFREFGIASTITFAVVFLTAHFLGLVLVLATGS